MADKKKMSVDEILAACRQGGGEGSSSTTPAKKDEPSPSNEPPKPQEPAATPKTSPASRGNMNVDEILAAARSEKASQATQSSESPQTSSGAEEKPAPTAASGAKPADMSLNEILAAARSGKAPGTANKGPSEPPQPKSTVKSAKKPREKASPKAAVTGAEGPKDTSSILAAARKPVKPGPMSKAEAEARGAKVEPDAKPKRVEPKGRPKLTAPPMPTKPAHVQPRSKTASSEERRGFIAVFLGSFLAVGFVSLGAVFGFWTLATARFMFPNILTEPPSRFKVGFPNDFAVGMVETKFKALFGVWVVHTEYDGQPQIFALRTVCTHLGCTPNWLDAEQKFKCPCHGSGFYKDGVNFEGPAPRPLERYAIRLADDGQLEVDKSRKFKEEMGQWRDSACFVTV